MLYVYTIKKYFVKNINLTIILLLTNLLSTIRFIIYKKDNKHSHFAHFKNI